MRAELNGAGILMRWILLLALGVQFSLNGAGAATISLLLALAGLWNVLLSVRWLHRQTWPRQALIEISVDLVIALALFYFSRTVLGGLAWVGLLPVFSAAWALGLGGGLAVAVLVAAAFAALAAIDVPLSDIPLRMAMPAFIYLAVAAVMGFFGRQLQFGLKQRAESEEFQRLERARSERERIEAVYEITGALGSTLVFDQVLEIALDLASNALMEPNENVSRTHGGVLLFDEGGLRLAAARRLAGQDIGRILPGQQGILAELLQSGEPRLAAAPAADAEFKLLAGLQSAQSLYAVPLVAGLDLFGVLFFAHPEANFFDQAERRELVSIVARQVMVALQNAQLYESLAEEKERIALIQEQARQQLARNLHDGPTQNVAAIAMRVNLARRLLARDAAAASDELYKIEDLSRRTTKEMRHMLFTLRPQALETDGLGAALRDLAKQMESTYDFKVGVEADEEAVTRMDRGKQGVLFFIAEEALSNANRHAKAQNTTLNLQLQDGNIAVLDVQDDGVGFDVAEQRRSTPGGQGLDVLRERVDLISAVMRLDSAPGRGTRLRVWVPLSEAAADRLRRGEL